MSMHRLAPLRTQRGLSLISTLIIGCLLAFVLFIAFRSVPVYNEYFALKRVLNVIAEEGNAGASLTDMRRSFDRYAYTDDIVSVEGRDLKINRIGGRIMVETVYERKVPVAGNVSLLYEFRVASEAGR